MKYLCYDTALNEEYTLVKLLQTYKHNSSLFKGTADEGIWDAAPWLFLLQDNCFELLKTDPFVQLRHVVIFETKYTLKDIIDYLQTRMYVKEEGQHKYYRIWDERVLLRDIQQWTRKEQRSFFDVFDCFYTDDAGTDQLIQWQMPKEGILQPATVSKSDTLPLILLDEDDLEEDEAATSALVHQHEATATTAPASTNEDEVKRNRKLR